MASILPPQPTGVPPNHAYWNDWYNKLRAVINGVATSIKWINLDFSGSKIEDIISREHNKLQSVQGGAVNDYYHLTSVQHSGIIGGNVTSLHKHNVITVISATADPTVTDITAGTASIYKNTTSGTVKLWTNDGGTMKSVTLT